MREETRDIEAVENLNKAREKILGQVKKVIVGQEQVIEEMLIALLSDGHCLLVGVPGLAKTLLVSTIARILDLKFNRIQFTPDLMPSDITGTDIIEEDRTTGKRAFRFVKGPVFANIVLADEINRTPPKTQAALLQAMQERQVTAGGETYQLDLPFFVLATQNPIEHEGTYPLPEAQLDRFMFNIYRGLPAARRRDRDRGDHDQRVRAGPGARAHRRGHHRAPAAGAPGAGAEARRGLRGQRRAGDAARRRRACRSSSRTGSAGAPGRGPRST